MTISREEIARLVDRLEHPDAITQQSIMDQLVALGPGALDPLMANFKLVSPRQRSALVRVFGRIGDDRALLPLMRYVFDQRDSVEEVNGRGLAMRAIMQLAGPDHAKKLFAFLMDLRDDPDPFVRGYALEAMGRFGDQRALPILREAMNKDTDEFVRERAQRAFEALQEHSSDSLRSDDDDQTLLMKIRSTTGGAEREFYISALLERPNAFELATTLMKERGKGALIGLMVLQKLDDPRARQAALRYFYSTEDVSHKAICLRILGNHLDGDADEREVRLLRDAFLSNDDFIRMAATDAAGASGDEELIRRAIRELFKRRSDLVAGAARSLSRGLHPGLKRLIPDIADALEMLRDRRKRFDEPDIVAAEAYMLRGLKKLTAGGGIGVAEAQRQALLSLQNTHYERPIVITALELLHDSVSQEPLPEERRWSTTESRALIELLDFDDEDVRWRVVDLLYRGAPRGLTGVGQRIGRLLYTQAPGLENLIIPVLARAGGTEERRVLEELTHHEKQEVREAAEAALRKIRNKTPIIDAKILTRGPE